MARMSVPPTDVQQTVMGVLSGLGKLREDFTSDLSLYAGGVGLDSLEIAELSAALEAAHGSDPFVAGLMPRTLDDILAFYAAAGT